MGLGVKKGVAARVLCTDLEKKGRDGPEVDSFGLERARMVVHQSWRTRPFVA